MNTPKYWAGPVPEKDDFGVPIRDDFIDGKTFFGPWAIMAPESHAIHGAGLGTGCGQWYEKQSDGRWLKIAG